LGASVVISKVVASLPAAGRSPHSKMSACRHFWIEKGLKSSLRSRSVDVKFYLKSEIHEFCDMILRKNVGLPAASRRAGHSHSKLN
jgi:hypothetical protein